MKTITTALLALLFAGNAHAFQVLNSSSADLGQVAQVVCSTGLTCTVAGKKLTIVSSPTITGTSLSLSSTLAVTGASTLTGGIASSAAAKTIFSGWKPTAFSQATSTTPSATVVYMTQIFIPHNVTLTGIDVTNAATCGTNKYIVALFDNTGAAVANSDLAGTMCSGTSAYQAIAFTGTYAAKGPRTYWIGIYLDGTTDRFYSIPAVGQIGGLAGSVTGQTFGTVATVVLPTTFTADKGPVAFVY